MPVTLPRKPKLHSETGKPRVPTKPKLPTGAKQPKSYIPPKPKERPVDKLVTKTKKTKKPKGVRK